MKNKLTTCLWFESQAEEAAKFYTSIFKDSSIGHIARFGKEGFEYHGQPEGAVMTVAFKLNGHDFMGLNGGPVFQFNESVSFVIECDTQEEIDYFWNALTEGGKESQCGWLKDKFGISWQVVPSILDEMMSNSNPKKVQQVTNAFLQMKKFNIKALQQAFDKE